MAKYIALSTANYQQGGYQVLAHGADKKKVRQAAENKIGDVRTEYGTDIGKATLHRNLMVVSKTKAKKYGIDYDNSEQWLEIAEDAVFVK